ncbi:MAG: hypothetical protein U0T81_00410 [Saprospiraceae bacterium]
MDQCAEIPHALRRSGSMVSQRTGSVFPEIKTSLPRAFRIDPGNYRSKEEVEHYKTLDPVTEHESRIINEKIASELELQ